MSVMELTEEEKKIIRDIRAMKAKPPEGPSPEDCLRHLLKGGWVRWPEYTNLDYVLKMRDGDLYWGEYTVGGGASKWTRATRFTTCWIIDRDTSIKCKLVDAED